MIFTARQFQEKCQEQNVDLYMTYVVLTKALTQLVVMDSRKSWPSLFACLFVLRLNIPVNNFSVMSGRSKRFLGLTSTVGN